VFMLAVCVHAPISGVHESYFDFTSHISISRVISVFDAAGWHANATEILFHAPYPRATPRVAQ